MKIKNLTTFFLYLFLAHPLISHADSFSPNLLIGDGKNGFVYAKWSQGVSNKAIEKVDVRLKRVKGGNDTFVNLRFDGQNTFEDGKREYLNDNSSKTLSWNVRGEKANGKNLVLNAYNGEVLIEEVRVLYQEGRRDSSYDERNTRERRGRSYEKLSDDAYQACRNLRRGSTSPNIEVRRARKTGNLFSGDYRVSGTISGQCLEEAGYYEYGSLKEKFEIPLDDRFGRHSFETKVRTGKEGEIRVFTIDGREDVFEVDREIGNFN